MSYYDHVVEAAQFLRIKLDALAPRIGIVLGSGLGAAAQAVADPVIVPYLEIPHFPQSTVEGHSGRIVAGLLNGTPVAIMQGRVHYYEGYTPAQVTFPMRVLRYAGHSRGGAHQRSRRHCRRALASASSSYSPTTSIKWDGIHSSGPTNPGSP